MAQGGLEVGLGWIYFACNARSNIGPFLARSNPKQFQPYEAKTKQFSPGRGARGRPPLLSPSGTDPLPFPPRSSHPHPNPSPSLVVIDVWDKYHTTI